MNQISIVHCADIHMGMAFSSARQKTHRKAEVKNTFINIVNLCEKNNIDILLIAGDLFDGASVGSEDMDDLIQAISSLTHTRVFISPGNHDFVNPQSMYVTKKWPDNTYIFMRQTETIELPSLGVRIMGAGFTSQYVRTGLITGNTMPSDDMINIGLFHGELVGKRGSSNYNPITDSDINLGNFDYLAIGHIHKQTEIIKAQHGFYAYPGCPEGHGFDETGIKGVYMGTVSKNECNLSYIRMCKRTYEELKVNISGCTNTSDIVRLIKDTMLREVGSDYMDDLYKITLTGDVSEDCYINMEDIKASLDEEIYYCKLRDNTRIQLDTEAVARSATLKGVYASKLLLEIQRLEENGDIKKASIYRNALNIGIKAFMGEVTYNED